MTEIYFREQIGRLSSEWPKSFSPEKQKLIAKALKDVPDYAVEKIVTHFLSTFRQAPLPKDFIDAALRETLGREQRRAEEYIDREPRCPKCWDCGVFEVQHDQTREIAFIRCSCLEGDKSFHQKLPQWDAFTFGSEFTPLYMNDGRGGLWKPEQGMSGLDEKAALWKAKIEQSLEFWRRQA